ncbi:hypothetical protein PAAG_02149 [Paracoccidioides lutzii Pb01]|uniref:Uncharacterized protein n=1 Tax=Paracoccidioides lutzii (strain ATCC MYA-826 / Pb01) TaxID=502779 RepID=C1GUF4_PARBA|nr:hypothetical protein PAAG_02149 [Paracoccidioides lutzii Pb01]EEH39960.1 hypothetical protein PAAG_02149 [Paracoccidioides lutzii Pb01]
MAGRGDCRLGCWLRRRTLKQLEKQTLGIIIPATGIWQSRWREPDEVWSLHPIQFVTRIRTHALIRPPYKSVDSNFGTLSFFWVIRMSNIGGFDVIGHLFVDLNPVTILVKAQNPPVKVQTKRKHATKYNHTQPPRQFSPQRMNMDASSLPGHIGSGLLDQTPCSTPGCPSQRLGERRQTFREKMYPRRLYEWSLWF